MPVGRAQDRLHDRIDGDGDRTQYPPARRGKEPTHEATWNAICLADFGDTGVAFVAMPQNPPRNVNWASSGRGCTSPRSRSRNTSCTRSERGMTEPYYEKVVMKLLDIGKIKTPAA